MAVIDGFFRSAVDLVLHLKVLPGADRRRVVSSILEVQKDSEENIRYNELFAPSADDVAMPASPPSTQLLDRLRFAGLEVTPW